MVTVRWFKYLFQKVTVRQYVLLADEVEHDHRGVVLFLLHKKWFERKSKKEMPTYFLKSTCLTPVKPIYFQSSL
jgi:hypothetical protein